MRISSLFLIAILLVTSTLPVYAQSLDEQLQDIEKQIKQLAQQKEQSENATKPLESELQGVDKQIADLVRKINAISGQIDTKEAELALLVKNIGHKEDELSLEHAKFVEQVKLLYFREQSRLPLALTLGSNNSRDFAYGVSLEASITKKNVEQIATISGKLKSLADDKARAEQTKKELENAHKRLASAKATINERASFLKTEITTAKKYQASLSQKLAELSQKQQSILAAKSGSFVTSIGAVPLSDDPASRPDYDPGFRPAFAPFSFGAYTHRKGMSQYGAKGRAEAGQNFKQILQAYYGKEPTAKDTGGSIKVAGHGEIEFEGKYLYGIAEMPSSFHKEALKAQAVAARSYAWRYKKDGKEICTSEACQVYSSSKAGNPPAEWKQAVEETKGMIIEDVVTYYSSTTGGYVNPLGWDTTDNQGGPGFATRAWESKANSPWFYKGWYTEGYSSSSDKCGRTSPWLKQEEMADILNAYLIQNKGGVDTGRITPITTSCWGGNPYSIDEMRNLANSVGGGAVSTISNVSLTYSTSGTTQTVTFATNRGDISIPGDTFKQTFNLRAPGYTSIKSPMFNIEKK